MIRGPFLPSGALLVAAPVYNERGIDSASSYAQAYAAGRREAARLSSETRAKIAEIYLSAAKEAAKISADSLERGLSELTTERWEAIVGRLTDAADALVSKSKDAIKGLIRASAAIYPEIDAEYLLTAARAADASEITAAGVRGIVSGIQSKVMASLVSRMWSDGYTFSDRVWELKDNWLESIKMTIAGGIAQGRDPVKIAIDLQAYTKDGKVELLNRWGNLVRGTSEFAKRIPKRIDWRAARLARSELYASLQDAAALAGKGNPGGDGLYDWVLTPGRTAWPCDCASLAANGPYKYEDLPTYPHAQCHPAGTKVLTVRGEVAIENIIPGDIVVSHDGSAQRVLNAWRNNYDGEMLTIKTQDGEIGATPDHPLFSHDSWLPSHLLKAGDDISRISIDIKSISTVKDIASNDPSKGLKKGGLFRILFLLLRGSGMPHPAIDFNGELFILKGKIDSVSADYKTRGRLFSESDQGLIQHAFIGRPELSGIELRYAGLVFIRVGLTPRGLMCGSDISLLPIGITPDMPLPDGWEIESEKLEIPANTTSGYSKNLRYLIDRETLIPEELSEFTPIKFNSCTHNSAIVSVLTKNYKGIVYNLSVENTHSYIANGFASHNCMCSIRPHLRDHNEFLSDLTSWAQGESVDYLDSWYKDTYQAAA